MKKYLFTTMLLTCSIYTKVFAAELNEKVSGLMTISFSNCERTDSGSSSCTRLGKDDFTTSFLFDLASVNNDNNHSGMYSKRINLKSGGYIFASVFINHNTPRNENDYYIVTLNIYGYDSEEEKLFAGNVLSTSIELYSVDDLKSTSLSSPIFVSGKTTQAILLSISKIQQRK